MRWDAIDVQTSLLILPETKAGKPQVVSLSAHAQAGPFEGPQDWRFSVGLAGDQRPVASLLEGHAGRGVAAYQDDGGAW